MWYGFDSIVDIWIVFTAALTKVNAPVNTERVISLRWHMTSHFLFIRLYFSPFPLWLSVWLHGISVVCAVLFIYICICQVHSTICVEKFFLCVKFRNSSKIDKIFTDLFFVGSLQCVLRRLQIWKAQLQQCRLTLKRLWMPMLLLRKTCKTAWYPLNMTYSVSRSNFPLLRRY